MPQSGETRDSGHRRPGFGRVIFDPFPTGITNRKPMRICYLDFSRGGWTWKERIGEEDVNPVSRIDGDPGQENRFTAKQGIDPGSSIHIYSATLPGFGE
jgi:hypothetical protein